MITADLPHRIAELLSIDHIAVPSAWPEAKAHHVVAEDNGARLSDHDLYVVETAGPAHTLD